MGLFCVIAAIAVFFLCLIGDESSLIALGAVGAFILGIVGVCIFSVGKELPDTYLYQVIVDDSVPIRIPYWKRNKLKLEDIIDELP